jgi:hypothetical protein
MVLKSLMGPSGPYRSLKASIRPLKGWRAGIGAGPFHSGGHRRKARKTREK